MPLFRGSSRFESLILSDYSRFACECNQEEINDDDDDVLEVLAELPERVCRYDLGEGMGFRGVGFGFRVEG